MVLRDHPTCKLTTSLTTKPTRQLQNSPEAVVATGDDQGSVPVEVYLRAKDGVVVDCLWVQDMARQRCCKKTHGGDRVRVCRQGLEALARLDVPYPDALIKLRVEGHYVNPQCYSPSILERLPAWFRFAPCLSQLGRHLFLHVAAGVSNRNRN